MARMSSLESCQAGSGLCAALLLLEILSDRW